MIAHPHTQGVLVLQSGTIPPDSERNPALLLDLDFVTDVPTPLSGEAARNWVEVAHEEIEAAFLACITAKTRTPFGDKTHGLSGD